MLHPKLQYIIEFLAETEQDSYTQICDNQLRFIFVGDKFCQLLSLESQDILYKNLRTINSPLSVLSDRYLALHLPLLQGVVDKIEYFTFMKYEQRVFIGRNSVNSIKDGNAVLGICIRTKMLDNINNLPLLKKCVANLSLTDYSVVSVSEFENVQDTNLDSDFDELSEVVLFLIMLGKYDKEITELCNSLFDKTYTVFSISKFVTRKLFVRFNVDSRNQLINRIMLTNALTKIPRIIFNSPDLYESLFSSKVIH